MNALLKLKSQSKIFTNIKNAYSNMSSLSQHIKGFNPNAFAATVTTSLVNSQQQQKQQQQPPPMRPTTTTKIPNDYKCPSVKSFQLPLIDISIIDILKRQELKLPEINQKKILNDPNQLNKIEKILPEKVNSRNIKIYCGRSLWSELKWRRRKMNRLKQRKYKKKMFYQIQKRLQLKEKRYQAILNLFKKIEMKKVEAFEPLKFIDRELEKAKFFGYKATNLYDDFRTVIDTKLKSFDDKFFSEFKEKQKPFNVYEVDEIFKRKIEEKKAINRLRSTKKT